MNTLKERLEQARLLKPKKTKKAIADAVGVSTASVNDWFSGKTKTMEAGNLLKAAKFLKVNAEWLATGRGPMQPDLGSDGYEVAENVSPYLIPPVGEGYTRIDIPNINVIEWVHLDELLESPMFQRREKVDGPRIFGLKIQDDTNEPKLLQGSIVEINVDRQAKPGDFVLARTAAGEPATIKQLIQDGGRTFLKPFNTRYPIIAPSNLQILGVVQRKIVIEDF